jgi:predicted transcriptional regulator of viral defense system
LIKESRGLYRLAESDPLGNPDFVQVSLLIPKSIIFLLSSLFFHGYTTQIPRYVYISLPHDIKKPRVNYPPLKVFRRSDKQYISGIEKYTIDGIDVRIYNLEKTITDCFKYRDKIGRDIAVEALKEYMGKPNPQIRRIMEYAKINQVEKIIRPYIETLS